MSLIQIFSILIFILGLYIWYSGYKDKTDKRPYVMTIGALLLVISSLAINHLEFEK